MNITFDPILNLNNNRQITALYTDPIYNCVLIGLSDGSILRMDATTINTYFTGERTISTKILDGLGNLSPASLLNIYYRLRNNIVRVDSLEQVQSTYQVQMPMSATIHDIVKGSFLTPVLYGGEDFIDWISISWNDNVPVGTKLTFYVRVAENEAALSNAPWLSFNSDTLGGSHTYSLMNLTSRGRYLQAMAILETTVKNLAPCLFELVIGYRTKYSVLFFTKKFVLDRKSNLSSGIIVANVSTPLYTELKFGMVGNNSANWDDYNVVPLNQVFEVPQSMNDRFKVGIKMIMNNVNNVTPIYPEVDNFAIMVGGDYLNPINEYIQSSSSESSGSSSSSFSSASSPSSTSSSGSSNSSDSTSSDSSNSSTSSESSSSSVYNSWSSSSSSVYNSWSSSSSSSNALIVSGAGDASYNGEYLQLGIDSHGYPYGSNDNGRYLQYSNLGSNVWDFFPSSVQPAMQAYSSTTPDIDSTYIVVGGVAPAPTVTGNW